MARKYFATTLTSKSLNLNTVAKSLDKFYTVSTPVSAGRRLSNVTCRQIYMNSPIVRQCIDGIAREIGSLEPYIVPYDVKKRSKRLKKSQLQEIKENFIYRVNGKGDTLSKLFEKITRDLLIYGCFFVEKVRNVNGRMIELYPRNPESFMIKKDKSGVYLSFVLKKENQMIEFSPDDIIYGTLDINSLDTPIPILEAIILEISTYLIAHKYLINYIFDEKSPASIIFIGKVGEKAFQLIKEQLESAKGSVALIGGFSRDEKTDVETIEKRLPLERELIDFLKRIDEIIKNAFQIEEVGARQTQVTIATLHQTYSRLTYPIICLLEDLFTRDVLHKEFGLTDFELRLYHKRISSIDLYNTARGIALLINSGVITPNEARDLLGLPPDYKGWHRFVKLGNEIWILNEDGEQAPTVEEKQND